MKKRMIAMVVCFVMVMTLIPMTVSAQEMQVTDTDILVQQGCIKIKGIVTENIYTDLDYPKIIDTSEENFIEIAITEASDTTDPNFLPDNSGQYNTMRFLVGTTDAADYLGLSVIAYVKPINDNYEIISIAPDAEKNEILEIAPWQFNQINSQGEFEFFESGNTTNPTSVNVENADVVFNCEGGYWVDDIFGDNIADYGETKASGKITLINNDLENGYDVIIVELAEVAVVDEAEDGYVMFKEPTCFSMIMDIMIDEYDTEYAISITKNGAEISAGELNEWDVLSIISNYDCTYIKAEVVTTIITGTIDEISLSPSSATGRAYTINGIAYDASDGAYSVYSLADGDKGIFYIDKYGRLVAYCEDPSTLHHFSLYFSETTDSWGFDDIYSDKIKETSTVYVALYNENHRMLYAVSDVLEPRRSVFISIPKNDDADYAKVFILKPDASPAAFSRQVNF